ncbi:hypothetical protein [Nocardia sp. NPDC002869]|uniref:hypothetical protein n=1 Tax=Nocardia sp. NPDC002869 TaxID=3161032 RepID=UPI00398CE876
MTALPELTTDLCLAGSWTRGGAGTFTPVDPSTGEELAEIAAASGVITGGPS